MLPEADVEEVRRWVDGMNAEVPEALSRQIWFDIELNDPNITVSEWHSDGPDDAGYATPVARLRYTKVHGQWKLYCMGGNLRFRSYEFAEPTSYVTALLREIDEDPTFIFWG